MNEQAERIAIEVFYKVKGAVFMGGLPTYNELPPYVRAEVDAIASLIRSHTAPRELVDAVKAYRVEKERGWPSDRPIDDAYFEACDNLEKLWQNVCSALSAQEPRVCGFEKHDDRSGKYFITDCGHETWINETSETFTNCPYCGGVIKVKE